MANYTLSNTSSQLNTAISESYSRITGNFSGPLNASSVATSGFLIQNGNKQTGLFVGNSCFVFGRNILDFSQYSENVVFKIPSSPNSFFISGASSNQILNFNSAGTLSVGCTGDVNYLGLQIVNNSPSIILKDINAQQNQSLLFRDSTDRFITCVYNNPSVVINSVSRSATQFAYNDNLIFGTTGNFNSAILSGCYLTINSGSCLNTQYNLSVGGSGYFSNRLCVDGILEANTACFYTTGFHIKGSGGFVDLNICNQCSYGTGLIDFNNASGGNYNRISSFQNPINGGSELDICVTPNGFYNSTDRKALALRVSGDRSVKFYGNLNGETGLFNYFIQSNDIRNSGCRTFLNTGANGLHCISLNDSSSVYSFCSANNCIVNHIWYTSGNVSAMSIDRSGNTVVTGSIFSHSGICSTGSLCINNLNLDSCLISRCAVLSGNSNSCNIYLYGNTYSAGTFENVSSSHAKFNQICASGNVSVSGLISSCNSICSTGLICSLGCIKSSSSGVFDLGVSSNAFVCAQSCGRFGTVVCAVGTSAGNNCFCNSIDVCGSVNAINTSKAWGIYTFNPYWTNFTGLNIKAINIYQTTSPSFPLSSIVYAFGICFNNPIKYPFVANFNVYPVGVGVISGHNANQGLGFSGAFGYINAFPSQLGPAQVQFYTFSGKCSSTNNLSPYIPGSTYSEVYFNFSNCWQSATPFFDLCRGLLNGVVHFSFLGN
jgi:hypothetical protein